jgi:hypothetical protein
MSGEKDTAVLIKKSVLKLICSELSEHPTKAGVIRFTAPKTKLEPYPDYDKEESNAAYLAAESANTTFNKDKRFPSDDVKEAAAVVSTTAADRDREKEQELESDEFSEYSEEEENGERSEGSFTESESGGDGGEDNRSASATEGETAEEEDDDDDDGADYYESEENEFTEPSDYEEEKRGWKREAHKPSVKPRSAPLKPSGRPSRQPAIPKSRSKRAVTDRSAYELSRRAPARERAKFERARSDGVRRSARIKRHSTDAGKVARGHYSESPTNARPYELRSGVEFPSPVKPSPLVRKRRADVSNAGGGGSKQPRGNDNTDRVSQIAPPKRKAGKILRGYNKPDKPAAKPSRKSARKSAKGAGDASASAAATRKPSDPRTRKDDDAWAPGKPFPNCDSLEYFE